MVALSAARLSGGALKKMSGVNLMCVFRVTFNKGSRTTSWSQQRHLFWQLSHSARAKLVLKWFHYCETDMNLTLLLLCHWCETAKNSTGRGRPLKLSAAGPR